MNLYSEKISYFLARVPDAAAFCSYPFADAGWREKLEKLMSDKGLGELDLVKYLYEKGALPGNRKKDSEEYPPEKSMTQAGIKKLLNRKSPPSRSRVIQIGLAIGLCSDELDILLRDCMGYDILYARDPWDAIVIFSADLLQKGNLADDCSPYRFCTALYQCFRDFAETQDEKLVPQPSAGTLTAIQKTNLDLLLLHSYANVTTLEKAKSAYSLFTEVNFKLFYQHDKKPMEKIDGWMSGQGISAFTASADSSIGNRLSEHRHWTLRHLAVGGHTTPRDFYIHVGILTRMPWRILNQVLTAGGYPPLNPDNKWEAALLLTLNRMFAYLPHLFGNAGKTSLAQAKSPEAWIAQAASAVEMMQEVYSEEQLSADMPLLSQMCGRDLENRVTEKVLVQGLTDGTLDTQHLKYLAAYLLSYALNWETFVLDCVEAYGNDRPDDWEAQADGLPGWAVRKDK